MGRLDDIGGVPSHHALRVLYHIYCNIEDLQGASFELCNVPVQLQFEELETRPNPNGSSTTLKSVINMRAPDWNLTVTLRHLGFHSPIPTDSIHIFGDFVYVIDYSLKGETAWLRDMTIFLMLESEWLDA